MQKIKILSLLLVLLVCSCAPVYTPSLAHVPLLKQQGDAEISFYKGSTGSEFKGAYALSGDYMLLSSFFLNDVVGIKQRYGELALGIYDGKDIFYQALVGLGTGGGYGVLNYQYLPQDRYNGHYVKLYTQGAVGLSTPIIDFGISLKVYYLEFTEIHINGLSAGYPHSMFMEPVLFGSMGYKNVKIGGQAGFALAANPRQFTRGNINMDYRFYNEFVAGIGVVIQLPFRRNSEP